LFYFKHQQDLVLTEVRLHSRGITLYTTDLLAVLRRLGNLRKWQLERWAGYRAITHSQQCPSIFFWLNHLIYGENGPTQDLCIWWHGLFTTLLRLEASFAMMPHASSCSH
jgi:hypothetical protein